jgi:hypothetical protein
MSHSSAAPRERGRGRRRDPRRELREGGVRAQEERREGRREEAAEEDAARGGGARGRPRCERPAMGDEAREGSDRRGHVDAPDRE